MKERRLVVGISGSSGVILGIRLLQALQQSQVETHLVISPAARLTIEQETRWKVDDLLALADFSYNHRDLAARIASGSYAVHGMVVIPCSIKTLSGVANSYTSDLLTRAADVTLKEGRPLLLVVREAPLHGGHIRLLKLAAAAGAIIFPPVPAFYAHPQSVDALVNNIVGRVLVRLGIENQLYQTWEGATQADPRARLLEEILSLPVLHLATAGADGDPHVAPVYFAAEGLDRLYFFSLPSSQHTLDLAGNPQAAGAISPLVERWQDIHGLQLRGNVQELPPGLKWERAWQVYSAKFPFAAAMKDELARNRLFLFTPTWARLLDNLRGFGYKEEWSL
jgi:flavin prenyltransferase